MIARLPSFSIKAKFCSYAQRKAQEIILNRLIRVITVQNKNAVRKRRGEFVKQRDIENERIAENRAGYAAEMVLPAQRTAARERKIVETALERFRAQLATLTRSELKQIAAYFQNAQAEPAAPDTQRVLVNALTEGREYGEVERMALEAAAQYRAFTLRQALLADALTAPEAARLLGTSRQTPHDRARSKTLLAVPDSGVLKFPAWQFDAAGPHGVVPGLPEVLRALALPPLSQARWLTLPNAQLQNRTPLEELRRGRAQRVTALARAVGSKAA